MDYVLTFVASSVALTEKHIRKAREIALYYNIAPMGTPKWLEKSKAADLIVSSRPGAALLAHLREEFSNDGIDAFVSPENNRRKKLLLADMESTIVDKEALDELAEFLGIRDKIAAITEKAMEGKLDFKAALRERVKLLKDLPEDSLRKVLVSMNLNPGAERLVRTMKKHGASCVLISGGFTYFTGPIARAAGFDHHHGNVIGVENGKLSGTVEDPILDKTAKLEFLKKYVAELGINDDDVMAIGDGANDIPMLKAAGLGVGYRPKEAVAKEMDNLIIHGGLDAALYIQQYVKSDLS